MIDISNEVYDALVTALDVEHTGIKTASVYTNMPTEFPFVSLEEIGNSVYMQGMDDEEIENFADVDYEINIYTQNPLKKSKANEILQVVDTFFKQLGFIRLSKNNIQDSNETTYRIIARYTGVVSKDHIVYRR